MFSRPTLRNLMRWVTESTSLSLSICVVAVTSRSVLRMIFSMFGRAISVRASIEICSSTFGCTASPAMSGFSTVWVSTNTRAVAS